MSLMNEPQRLSHEVRQYLIVTGNYWAFTLTDGALRMLVVLHFYGLGYSPLAIAMLFVFYEFFGVVTNLVGGWLGARIGLNRTMNLGLFLQVLALVLLAFPEAKSLSVAWVMMAQALSGVAKDLNKMSAKSAIKTLVVGPDDQTDTRLYRWVAILTGSKNTLKGIGFFLGGALLEGFGFSGALWVMVGVLGLTWLNSTLTLKNNLGRAKNKPKFRELFSKSPAINYLSAARLFLFAARDVWFVVALPVFLASVLGWNHYQVGGFLACWVMGYGAVQTLAPVITGHGDQIQPPQAASRWAWCLAVLPMSIACALGLLLPSGNVAVLSSVLLIGLFLFGVVFAVNSSLHSYLIVRFANAASVSLDVGFYYMANAMGRLLGTLLSGWVYQQWGLAACLWISSLFVLLAGVVSLYLPLNTKTCAAG